MPEQRPDGRAADEMRPIKFIRDYTKMAQGSVLACFGETQVLCTASLEKSVPDWMKGKGRGWVTAEYSLLPGSSPERVRREAARGKQTGRTMEIQRLIGRSLRAVTNLKDLGEKSVVLDCDVLQADGGTRTAAISGAYMALSIACRRLLLNGELERTPLNDSLAAVSVGIYDGQPVLDLNYPEDSKAEVDMNVVTNGKGEILEVQGTAEGSPFSRDLMDQMMDLAEKGISEISKAQEEVLGE